jgi:DNA-binding response OmpR family regulator
MVAGMPHETILIAEDDSDLLKMMGDYLANDGYQVIPASDGNEALRLWRTKHPDLLILDWMLPGLSGLEIARRIRAENTTPIIMVTARGEEPDIVVGLELGADDYLIKPVSLRQLSARIYAVLRRSHMGSLKEDSVVFARLHVDFTGQVVDYDGQTIPMTGTEFKLLAVLARNPNRVYSRLQLMEEALGDYYEGYERTIDSHISRLRSKIGINNLIQTVHGSGYKLVPPTR